jgi:hypothetical protein
VIVSRYLLWLLVVLVSSASMMTEQPPPPDDALEMSKMETAAARRKSLEETLESLVRVTLAALGGAAVGLAQQQQVAPPPPGPRRTAAPLPHVSYPPRAWALSCLTFVLILETSRRTSPVTMMMNATGRNGSLPPALVTVGDYTVGGLLAGAAGSWGRRVPRLPAMRQPPRRLWFGMGTGMLLGCGAGLLQAALDASTSYLQAAAAANQANAAKSGHSKSK